jgi:hypothetical protein
MNIKYTDVVMPPAGFIKLVERDKATKEITKIIEVKNTVTYEGAKVLAHAIAGDNIYHVTHIYGEHADQAGSGYIPGTLNGLVASKTDTIDVLRTPPRTTVNAESPVIMANYLSSDVQYNDNVVTFTASWSSDLIDNRIVVGAGLVVQVAGGEILYAHAYFPAQIKNPGKELICHWSQLFV